MSDESGVEPRVPAATAGYDASKLNGVTVPPLGGDGAVLTVGGGGTTLEWDVPAAGVMLSNASPSDVGVSSPGVGTKASRDDHVHPHGNQVGGTLHAVVVAAGAAGFMSGADKTKLDGITAGATNTPLSGATPQSVGPAAAGTGMSAARDDHVHAHGNQSGGSLHALAVAAGAAGFLSGTDKTKLDNLPSSLSLPLSKANGGLGQSVATGLTFGDGLYVDSSGVLQIGKPHTEHEVVLYSGATSTEQAAYPGPTPPQNLSSVNGVTVLPHFVASAAGSVSGLFAGLDSNVMAADSLVIKVRKSSNQGSTWSDLLSITIAAGNASASDNATEASFSRGDWIQTTVKASTGTNFYYGGARFRSRYT